MVLFVLISVSPIIGAFLYSAFGYIGGTAIDTARRRRFRPASAVALLAVALCGANAVVLLGIVGLLGALDIKAIWTTYDGIRSWLASPLGWAFGLFVSGFPSVLRASSRVENDSQPAPALS